MRISDKGPSYPQLHMSTTKTSQQLAKELARKCAIDIDLFVMNAPRAKNQEEALALLSNSILQSIPLVELLDCYTIVKAINKMLPNKERDDIVLLLQSINTKLHQLGIEI